jgi:hypothetical protein
MKLSIHLDTSKVSVEEQGEMVASILSDLASRFKNNEYFDVRNHINGHWGVCSLDYNGLIVGEMELLKT